MNDKWKWYLLWGAIIALILLETYKFIWGPEGVKEYFSVRKQSIRVERETHKIELGNERLKQEIEKLKVSPAEREKIVREKLNYVKDGEIHYHFVKGDNKKE